MTAREHPSAPGNARFFRKYRAVVLVAIAGLAVSTYSTLRLYTTEREAIASAFEDAAQDQIAAIANAVEVNMLVLESIHSLYQSSGDLGYAEFAQFARPLLGNLYGVRALDWIPCVRDAGREAFEIRLSDEYGYPFKIKEYGPSGALQEAGRRPIYFPVLDAAPRGEPSAIAGFDLASDAARRDTVERAIETGRACATPALTLLREEEGQLGFQIFLPLFDASVPAETAEARRAAIRGFVLGVFRIPDLIEGALSELQPRGIDVRLTDLSSAGGPRLLYTHASRLRGAGKAGDRSGAAPSDGALQSTAALEVAGRAWSVHCTEASGVTVWKVSAYPLLILACGLSITALLCAYAAAGIGRNAALNAANSELRGEIEERWRAEEELQRYRNRLEDLVQERTAALETAQRELVRKEKLATIGQLIAMVSHELRNPLATVQNAIFTIGECVNQGDASRAERALGLAERNIRRCGDIISELLDFARQRKFSFQRTEIDRWLESVLAELDLPAGISCEYDPQSNRHVDVDREHLRRAVINVVTNAVQAMAQDTSNGSRLAVETRVAGARLEMRFADNGPGIPPELLEKIFEPLFSTRSSGVGLGVPIVLEIMQGHGGGVEYESTAGPGTIVVLWVPCPDCEES